MFAVAVAAIVLAHLVPVIVSSDAKAQVMGTLHTVAASVWLSSCVNDGEVGTVVLVVAAVWGLRQAASHEGDAEVARFLSLAELGIIVLSLGWRTMVALCVA